jgi:hypothetical protein
MEENANPTSLMSNYIAIRAISFRFVSTYERNKPLAEYVLDKTRGSASELPKRRIQAQVKPVDRFGSSV